MRRIIIIALLCVSAITIGQGTTSIYPPCPTNGGGTTLIDYSLSGGLGGQTTRVGGRNCVTSINLNDSILTTITKQWYSWDNQSSPTSPSNDFRVVHQLSSGNNAIVYGIGKNSDAHYEVRGVKYCNLYDYRIGEVNPANGYDNTASYALRSRIDHISFTGTGVKIQILKSNAYGILGAILYDGNFDGRITTNASATFVCNRDKRNDDYYLITQTGSYAANLGLGTLDSGSLIHWKNSAWTVIPKANVVSMTYDTYSASSNTAWVTLFSGLSNTSHRIGVFATGNKNSSSSGSVCWPKRYAASNPDIQSSSTFEVLNPSSYTWADYTNGISIISDAVHFEMSTTVKDSGAAYNGEWIPQHGVSTSLYKYANDTINFYINGVKELGLFNYAKELTECDSIRFYNYMYASNINDATNKLMDITVNNSFTKNGYNVSIKYKALQKIIANTGYSFMLPYSRAVFNSYFNNSKEKISIPLYGESQKNITSGNTQINHYVYNDSINGTYNKLIFGVSVNNISSTNLNSYLQCFISTYNSSPAYGKYYNLAFQNKYFYTNEVWNVNVKYFAAYKSNMLDLITQYLK